MSATAMRKPPADPWRAAVQNNLLKAHRVREFVAHGPPLERSELARRIATR